MTKGREWVASNERETETETERKGEEGGGRGVQEEKIFFLGMLLLS